MAKQAALDISNILFERKSMPNVFDNAMNVQDITGTGGIDLNPAQMSMQVKNDGEDFKFDFNGTEIDAAQVTGVTFTICEMTPVSNLLLILGLAVSQGQGQTG
jgi:N-methylhydantoinase B/oxoprolinase/acetone carboxylase alpha subunit